jgi:hypothetical protein
VSIISGLSETGCFITIYDPKVFVCSSSAGFMHVSSQDPGLLKCNLEERGQFLDYSSCWSEVG